jgi:hypothetical protein
VGPKPHINCYYTNEYSTVIAYLPAWKELLLIVVVVQRYKLLVATGKVMFGVNT